MFALGCVLFECLTGQPALDGDSLLAVLSKIVLADAPRPSSLAAVPPAVDELVGHMLEDHEGRERLLTGVAENAALAVRWRGTQ